MQIAPPAGHGDHAVQKAAPLVAVIGDVLVLEGDEAEAREDGVAVVAVIVDGVAAVDMLPAIAGEEGVLRLFRVRGEAQREALVEPLHFLQKHEVRVEDAQPVAQVMQHHAAVEVRQALMDIERDDAQALDHQPYLSPSTMMASRFDQEKHFCAASRHGSQPKPTCSFSAIVTGTRAGRRSAKTCSML